MMYSRSMDQPPVFAFDIREFFEHFQDHLAPKLDTYEQAIYLYVFRHSRLLNLEEITIGFKSARHRLATGVGWRYAAWLLALGPLVGWVAMGRLRDRD